MALRNSREKHYKNVLSYRNAQILTILLALGMIITVIPVSLMIIKMDFSGFLTSSFEKMVLIGFVNLVLKGLIDVQRTLLIQTDHESSQYQTQIGAFILQIIMNFILIYQMRLGLLGALFSVTLTNLVLFIVNEHIITSNFKAVLSVSEE